MSRKVIVFIAAFVLLTGLGMLFLRNKAGEPSVSSTTPTPTATTDTNAEAKPNTSTTGIYADYSDTAIANASGERVLFFHAPWCSQCRSIESGIKDQGVPAGLTVIKVDYDGNQALRKKYGVTLQTTFVKVTNSGEFIDKYVAYDEPTFDAVKRNFL